MFPTQPNQKKPQQYSRDNILESLRSVPSSVGASVAKDVVGNVATDALNSILGTHPKPQQGGELTANQPVEVGKAMQRNETQRSFQPEFMRPMRAPMQEAGIDQKIQAVRAELAALSKSIASLNTEIRKAITEVPVEPGVYHLTFLERLKSLISSIRENIDDSRTWLALSTQRKKKRGYWGMYKKHGTSFGLSSERNLATQAG